MFWYLKYNTNISLSPNIKVYECISDAAAPNIIYVIYFK